MRAQRVLTGEPLGDLTRQRRFKAPLHIDACQLAQLGVGLVPQLLHLPREIGPLGVRLGADRDIFTCGHRHGAGHQRRHAGQQDLAAPLGRGGHAQDQAGRGDDAVVGPEHRRAQPADAVDQMSFAVQPGHVGAPARSAPETCGRALTSIKGSSGPAPEALALI